MGAVHCKNEGMLLEPFTWCCIESVIFICSIHANNHSEHVFVFKSCNISIHWWIWMLSFLLKQNWLGIDYFLLKFFATFASVLRLQITVTLGSVLGLQVNSGLQPPTYWEPFVASTMLRRPKPTKERVELTILSTIAIEITHLKSFALLLLLRILRYMWTNHVATWAQANNSGRNLDLNKIQFSHLHYILQSYGVNLKNLSYFICIWKRHKVTV